MSKEPKKKITSWAEFRFSVIGGLLACPHQPGELRKEIEQPALRTYQHPTKDQLVQFGASTIERWYYRAKDSDDPVSSMGRKLRSDLGKNKAMSPILLHELKKQYICYPHFSYQLHFDNLCALVEEKPELGKMCSYSTILRRMKERGWYKKSKKLLNPTEGQKQARERIEQKEVRGFEMEYAHALWHLDFHQGSKAVCDRKGQWHKPIPEDSADVEVTNSDPIPPLLRKMLKNYAATGMPPAYLSKEDEHA